MLQQNKKMIKQSKGIYSGKGNIYSGSKIERIIVRTAKRVPAIPPIAVVMTIIERDNLIPIRQAYRPLPTNRFSVFSLIGPLLRRSHQFMYH